jgi:hypothetical protein
VKFKLTGGGSSAGFVAVEQRLRAETYAGPDEKRIEFLGAELNVLRWTALAEAVRFELTDDLSSAVFKTAGLNRSPKPPGPGF